MPHGRHRAETRRAPPETEPTNVVSTPDIPHFVDSDDEGVSGRRSFTGVSPPMSSSPPEIIVEHHTKSGSGSQSSQPVKRGRKKQLHPQQVSQIMT